MTIETQIIARSQAVVKSWKTLDWQSVFSAIIYPALGVLTLVIATILGLALESLRLHWWYAPISLAVIALTIVICNQGIGPLHRIWQHRAGEMKWPAGLLVIFNCTLAMQGKLQDWVNYHSQHHRHSDQPGDPHNPEEGKFWAWIGWILWRDEADRRPMPRWLADNWVVRFADQFHLTLSLVVHLLIPLAVYLIVGLAGGSLLFTALIHASVVTGRAIQFHATTLGVNVCGHIETPKWLDYTLAMLTGGEALHGHHHDFPRSALNLPKNGLLNRIIDYNGTFLLVLKKLRLTSDLIIAPQFVEEGVRR